MRKPGIHFARIDKSNRLQKLYRVLKDGKKHSSLEINAKTGSVCVGTLASELRHNRGFAIDCEYLDTLPDGSKIYNYQMVRSPKAAEE